jgi:subtilisin family serine protease
VKATVAAQRCNFWLWRSGSGPDGDLTYPPARIIASSRWRQRGWADVQDRYASSNFYISDFSGRDPDGLAFENGDAFDFDVAAPGSWVVGPYGFNNGQINYAFVGGTSQATPHVTGIVALMLQKNPSLTAAQIEACLEDAAQPLTDSDQQVIPLAGLPVETPPSWSEDRAGHGFITADAALSSDCF